jgi:catechol 2,3-dioxygenase-like lactoylglutathione lyase family enzyme
MKVKRISWVGIGTDSFDETLTFFTEMLGLTAKIVDPHGVAMLGVGDDQLLELFGPGTQGRALTVPPVVAFEVDDVAAAHDELSTRNIELIGDIGRWNGFEWFYFRGPDDHIYAIKKTPPPGWETTA